MFLPTGVLRVGPEVGGEWGLVASAVFKTVVSARKRRRVGSIPTRLRHVARCIKIRSRCRAAPRRRRRVRDVEIIREALTNVARHSNASRVELRLLKSGASGYVSKSNAREHLATAIRKVARGERFLTPALAESLAFDLMNDTTNRMPGVLSDREFQVFC